MKKHIIALFAFLISLSLPLFGGTVEIEKYPVFQGIPQAETQSAIDDIIIDANSNELIKKLGDQKNVASSFANASAYSLGIARIYTASQQQTFYISAGAGGALLGSFDELQNVGAENADPKAGVVGNGYFTGGFNADIIPGMPVKGLLFNAKFGYNNLEISKMKLQSMLFGAGIDYKLFTPEAGTGAVQLAPVVIGTGFVYSSSSFAYTKDDEFTSSSGTGATLAYYKLDQSSTLNIKSTVITVPVEIFSSVKLAWFLNIFAGVGCDIAFGGTEISVDSDSKISAYRDAAYSNTIEKTETEEIALRDSTTKAAPAVVQFRTTVGTGFALGAVHLDFPFTYYPAGGFAFAATAAVVL